MASTTPDIREDNQEIQDARADEGASHVETKWQCCKRYPMTIFWIGVMVWMMIVVGFDNQAGGSVLSVPEFRKDYGLLYNGQYILPASWQSAISGGPAAVTVAGLVTASYLADIFGKKYVLTAGLIISAIGIGIEYASDSIAVFFAGKMINGYALGIFLCLCLSYTAEISPLPLRGITTGCMNIAQCIGPLLGAIMVNYTGVWTTQWSYRSLYVAQWGFGLPALLVQIWMPESPIYLLTKSRHEAAKKSFRRLCSNDGDADNRYMAAVIMLKEAEELSYTGSFLECFKGTNLRRTLLSCLVFFTHPMSGVSFIGSYGAYIFQLIGVSSQESFKIGIGTQVLSISGNLFGFYIIDKFGRRTLILGGVTCLMVDLLCSASTGLATWNPAARTACVAFLSMFNFFYNGGIGNVAYTLAAELPTSHLRSKTITIAIGQYQAINCMWTFVLPFIINPNEGNLEARVGYIFFALLAICLVLLYFYIPETKDRTFEETDELFSKKVPARKFKSYITEVQLKNKHAAELEHKIPLEKGGIEVSHEENV